MAPKKEVHIVSVAPFDMQGRLLMGLRNDVGRWTLPGGHLEGNEHPIVGALRELHEETGLRPGAGGLEYLGSFPLDHGGNKLRIHSFRATGVSGQPTGSKDPDQECERWDWHDVTQGLPEHVEKNLYNAQDVTLQALGFQKGPMRKFEQPPSLDLRLPALARLLKTETKTGDREKAKELVNLVQLARPDREWRPEADARANQEAAAAASMQLSEMQLPPHVTSLLDGDFEDVRLAMRHPNFSRLDREIVLQRTLSDEELLNSSVWMGGIMEPLADSLDEDQRSEILRRMAGRPIHTVIAMLGTRPLTDVERAAALENIPDEPDPVTSTVEERQSALHLGQRNATWAMQLLNPPYKEGFPEGGFDHLTPDQLDRLHAYLNPAHLHGKAVIRHPNLSDATVKKELDALWKLREFRSDNGYFSMGELHKLQILNNPKVTDDQIVDYVRSNLNSNLKGGIDADELFASLRPSAIDRLAPDLMHHSMRTGVNWTTTLNRHYGTGARARPLPEDAKDVLIEYGSRPEEEYRNPLRMFRDMWLGTPAASVADRKKVVNASKHPGDAAPAIAFPDPDVFDPVQVAQDPQSPHRKFVDEMNAWHQELMRGDRKFDAIAAAHSAAPAPPEYLQKIDDDLQKRDHSQRLEVLRNPDRHFVGLDPGLGDLLAKHAAHPHAAEMLVDAARKGLPGLESRHLDPLLNDPSPSNADWRQALAESPAISGKQLHVFLRRPDIDPKKAGDALLINGHKLERDGAKDLVDDVREPIASLAARHLHPDDITAYIRRPGTAQRPTVLDNIIRVNPHFNLAHMKEIQDTEKPGSPHYTAAWQLGDVSRRENATPDMLRHLYHARTTSPTIRDGFVEEKLLNHKNTPSDVLWDIERRVRNTPPEMKSEFGNPLPQLEALVARAVSTKRDEIYKKILTHPNLDLPHLKEMGDAFKAKHPGMKVASVAHWLPQALERVHPDAVYKKSVTIKPGTERLREIRDLIAEREPDRQEISPKHLPPGDWSAGRAPNGNISAKLLQQHIDSKPGQTFNLSMTSWDGPQRHNSLPSRVLQVNLTTKHLQELREKGLHPTFQKLVDASFHSSHPVTKHTLGWIRFTGDKRRGFFIDEIQSDFAGNSGRTHVQRVRSEAQRKAARDGLSPERAAQQVEEAVKRAQEQWPEEHERAINDVIWGGRAPNQVLHEAFLQHLRDRGYEGVPVHMHSVETKAPISLGMKDAPVPAHMKETYGEQPRKMGYKPVRYGDISATRHTVKEIPDSSEVEDSYDSVPTRRVPDPEVPKHLPGAIINGTKIRKSEDDGGLRAAFRDRDGKVTITGSIHDLYQLGDDANPDDFVTGYVDDDDGKFYTREDLKQKVTPAPIEKAERSWETNLSMWMLKKMAVKPEDLGAVKRYTDHEGGASVVDDTLETKAHPGHLEPVVSAFKTHVIDSPKVVRKGKTGTATSSNSTGKVVYDVKGVDLGEFGTDHRFMVKPYHEKIVPRMRAWHHAPTQGWAEMTNQALYHSAGIGHLHQEVHVAHLPFPAPKADLEERDWVAEYEREHNDPFPQTASDKSTGIPSEEVVAWQNRAWPAAAAARRKALENRGPVKQPVLVVHMRPGVQSIFNVPSSSLSPEQQEDARRIALMDFLSNNLDRHMTNLMVDPKSNHLLAIDHSRSFQYKSASKMGAPKVLSAPVDDSLKNYVGDGANTNGGGIGLALSRNWRYTPPPELAALEEKARRGEIPWSEPGRIRAEGERKARYDALDKWTDAWHPTFEWWQQHSEAIRNSFKKRLALIKDSNIRNHMWRNFQARQKVLDEYARDGHDNYGRHDWHHFTVPIFRLGTKLHENEEFSDWFDKDV